MQQFFQQNFVGLYQYRKIKSHLNFCALYEYETERNNFFITRFRYFYYQTCI